MKSPSVLPVDPAGPADPAFAGLASAGHARSGVVRGGGARKVLEKRRGIDRVSHEDPQAIIIELGPPYRLAEGWMTMRESDRTETPSGTGGSPIPSPLTFSVRFPASSRRRRRAPSQP